MNMELQNTGGEFPQNFVAEQVRVITHFTEGLRQAIDYVMPIQDELFSIYSSLISKDKNNFFNERHFSELIYINKLSFEVELLLVETQNILFGRKHGDADMDVRLRAVQVIIDRIKVTLTEIQYCIENLYHNLVILVGNDITQDPHTELEHTMKYLRDAFIKCMGYMEFYKLPILDTNQINNNENKDEVVSSIINDVKNSLIDKIEKLELLHQIQTEGTPSEGNKS